MIWVLLLKNSRRYDINCFKFNIAHRIRKYSCPHVNFYGLRRASTEKQDFHNKQGFYSHRFRKQPHCFPHHDKSNLQEDEKEDSFHYAVWARSQARKNSSKNHRYRDSLGCDSKWDKDWSTKHQSHAYRAANERQFWIWLFLGERVILRCSYRNEGYHLDAYVCCFHQERLLRSWGWSSWYAKMEPSHRYACLGLRSARSMCRNFNLLVWWHHNL